ncbi:MAG: APC family permease [Actinobacteria bacterium]|nr:APC family permease [Actinomycetota bacterium]
MYSAVKRFLVGRPLSTAELEHQRLPKTLALPVFSSDALSSTAYASEEILFVTAVGASSLALGLSALVPIALAVAILLAIVVTSYRQTIHAYPTGGGSYVVSRENLGRNPSLVAGAALLVDYTLTVAVSVSAGVAALVSIPTFRHLGDNRVGIALILLSIIGLANLRGVRESGAVFAAPTYSYVLLLSGLVFYGLAREFLGTPVPDVPLDPERFEGMSVFGGELGLFLILKGFSSGAVALTGIEAMADGVPVFRKPESKNAAITLTIMAVILGTLFFGTALLANRLRPYPSHEETVLSQMADAVFGQGALYLVFQLATAGILVLAANTAFADFPRVASIIARDGFLPRQLANRGDRLVFSNGIVILGLGAGTLITGFGGRTNALIPLYAVGVFTSFTFSQAGMVRYQRKWRRPGWQLRATVSGFGAVVTSGVLLVVAVTKFTSGAWVPLVVVPSIISVFLAIRRHYDRVDAALAITPEEVKPEPLNHTVVVLVGRIDRRALKALDYASSLRPNHIMALYIAQEEADREAIQAQWEAFGIAVPLEIKGSPYRELVEPVERFLEEIDQRWTNDTVTVVIPEFVLGKGVAGKWLFENVLHNQSALALKLALLYRPNTVVTSVPFHVDYAAPGGDADKAGTMTP